MTEFLDRAGLSVDSRLAEFIEARAKAEAKPEARAKAEAKPEARAKAEAKPEA